MGTKKPHALIGTRIAWDLGGRLGPDLDLAVISLDAPAGDDLEREYQFSTPADTAAIKAKTPGVHYMIAGYPYSRNRIKYPKPPSLPSMASWFVTGDIGGVSESEGTGKVDGCHFTLGLRGDEVPRLDGGRFMVPKVQGMSGGGVWRIEYDIPDGLATLPLLVGIGIEYIKPKHLFVATCIQKVIPLVRDLMELEAGATPESLGLA
jgi:hypothetical protein